MFNFFRKTFIVLAVFLTIIFVVLKIVDANFCKEYLISLAHKNGFELKIPGDIKISLFPNISFVSDSKLEIYDNEEKSRKIMEVGKISLKLKDFSFTETKIKSDRNNNIDAIQENNRGKFGFGLKKIVLSEVALKNAKLFLDDHNLKILEQKFNDKNLNTGISKEITTKNKKINFSLEKITLKNSEVSYQKNGKKFYVNKINLTTDNEKKVAFSADVKYPAFENEIKVSGKLGEISDLMVGKDTKLRVNFSLKEFFEAEITGNINKKNLLIKIFGDLDLQSSFGSSKGSFKITIPDRDQIQVYFRGDTIVKNLKFPENFNMNDWQKSQSSNDPKQSEKFNLTNLGRFDVESKIGLEELTIYGLKIEKIRGVFQAAENRIRFKIDEALFENGKTESDFIFDFGKNHYKLNLSSSKIKAENILSLMSIKNLSGNGNLLADVTGYGGDWQTILRNSTGKIQADISDGKISKLNLVLGNFLNLSKLSFDHLKFIFEAQNGKLIDKGSELKSSLVDCNFKGYIDLLNSRIDYLIIPSKIYNSNIISKNMVINISGPLDKPAIRLDTNKIMENTAKEIAKKILPKNEDIENTLNKMLKQFF